MDMNHSSQKLIMLIIHQEAKWVQDSQQELANMDKVKATWSNIFIILTLAIHPTNIGPLLNTGCRLSSSHMIEGRL